MCNIQMQLQCFDSSNSKFLDNIHNTEISIESEVSMRLLAIFDEITVKDVVLRPFSIIQEGQRSLFFRICCQCPLDMSFLSKIDREYIELIVEDIVSCAMAELFETVIVEKVAISELTYNDDTASTLPRSA